MRCDAMRFCASVLFAAGVVPLLCSSSLSLWVRGSSTLAHSRTHLRPSVRSLPDGWPFVPVSCLLPACLLAPSLRLRLRLPLRLPLRAYGV